MILKTIHAQQQTFWIGYESLIY